ncbi:SDR family oxidoreductase [Gillisia limnaea]|uniref:NAD-dependent epimerase/dehydratase n=1 Tax=Gillisia limnaea (strain DSM 15749 / LMG 21470 / R-8282) TaxID=865937 RepID=H2BX55_GILLR|nr:NAD(P)H-binding protein [Gillisia limnaea]EHQ02007.1 NAD-dependent epimerase/dehydratase [Gillisia limnaea DSM 15749]
MEDQEKILVIGASGALGLEIVKLLKQLEVPLRVLTNSSEGVSKLAPYSNDIWKVDASTKSPEIKNITKGVSTVISSLGKSISLFSPSVDSFYETDYAANKTILDDAVMNGVKRFVYVSIKGVDSGKDFNITKAHKMFEEELISSGLDYTILRPVGFYSGLNDLAIMAKRKVLPIVGDGDAKTNSIHHKDMAEVVVSYAKKGPKIIEIGGPKIHTRLEMAEMVKERFGATIIKVPKTVADIGAMIPNFLSGGTGDKLDYYTYITTNDMIGESRGSIVFKDYLKTLDLKELP